MAGSSLASDMQRMISSIVNGLKAFLLSGLLIVICMSKPENDTHQFWYIVEVVSMLTNSCSAQAKEDAD